jgi:iron complex outermembrane recepter protein
VFTNITNLTDELYANQASRGNNATDRTTYMAAAPRTFTVGVQYNFVGR